MAIFHLSAKIISRSSGRSVTAAAAYRAGEKIRDERSGTIFDYTRKKDVSYRKIFSPPNMPLWVSDRQQLWNAVEIAEVRKDAQLAREVEIALPIELDESQHVALIERFARSQFARKGMIADVVIHNKNGNPHAHILLTTRDIGSKGFGQKNRDWNTKEQLAEWRFQWERYCNRQLSLAGHAFRIDHRSLESQGVSQIPTVHVGSHSSAMQKLGLKSTRCELNKFIKEKNMKEDNARNGIPEFEFLEGGPTEKELAEKKNSKHLFITANDFVNHKEYARARFSRMYVPILIELFGSICLSIEQVETEIGSCYRIKLPTGAVSDFGSQIRIENGTVEEIQVAVQLAGEKGWRGLHLTGNQQFKEAMFLEAVISGAFTVDQVTGYVPSKANLDVISSLRPTLKIEPKQDTITNIFFSGDSSSTGGSDSESGSLPKPTRRLKL